MAASTPEKIAWLTCPHTIHQEIQDFLAALESLSLDRMPLFNVCYGLNMEYPAAGTWLKSLSPSDGLVLGGFSNFRR